MVKSEKGGTLSSHSSLTSTCKKAVELCVVYSQTVLLTGLSSIIQWHKCTGTIQHAAKTFRRICICSVLGATAQPCLYYTLKLEVLIRHRLHIETNGWGRKGEQKKKAEEGT